MDADRFDLLLRTVTESATRRGIVRTLASLVAGGIGGSSLLEEAYAKKRKKKKKKKKKCGPCRKRKKGKCKRKLPNGTSCENGRGFCENGTCRCGGRAACRESDVCQDGDCFPTGSCPEGTQACVPETGTLCGDHCFCATSTEAITVCIDSAGLCEPYVLQGPKASCTTGEDCSFCQTSDGCPQGKACIEFSGCCEGVAGRAALPAGTKTCADPCFSPTV